MHKRAQSHDKHLRGLHCSKKHARVLWRVEYPWIMEQSQMQPNRTVFMDGVAVQEGGFQKSQKLAKHPYCSINFPAPLNSVVLWLCGNPEEEYREQHIGAFRLMFAKGQVESPPQRSKAILPLPTHPSYGVLGPLTGLL